MESDAARPIEIVADGEAIAQRAAQWVVDCAVPGRDVHIALAGGSTPRRAYQLLAATRHDWSRVDWWFGDERCVPPDHPDSNYRMAKEAFFDPAAIRAERIHRMAGEAEDRDAAARDYADALPGAFDLLLLGVGPDGHTASLFPGSAALRERRLKVVAVTGPKPPPNRLTITPRVIVAAQAILVLAAGSDKAAAVRRARIDGPDDEAAFAACPARLLRRADWLVDRAAAAKLERR